MSSASFSPPRPDGVQLDTQLYTMTEPEGIRYRAYFTKLIGSDGPLIYRDAALEFFRKSSLPDDQLHDLYTRIKGLRLLQDLDYMNETEFILGMHFIVCMAKRNLAKIPPKFPSYLFPTLDLTPENVSSQVSQVSSNSSLLIPSPASDAPASFMTTSSTAPRVALVDLKSPSDLVTMELQSKQHEVQVLSRVNESEARALQSLQLCVERVADQVDKLGFPVPSSLRSLNTLGELRSLLQKHVVAARQEIQSMEIDAQSRSVASKGSGLREDPLKVAGDLTQELLTLQHQTAQLMAKKADVIRRLMAVTTGGSAAESNVQQPSEAALTKGRNAAFNTSKGTLNEKELEDFLASMTPPKNSSPALVQSGNNASSGWSSFTTATSQGAPSPRLFEAKIDKPPASNDLFSFGSSPTAVDCTKSRDQELLSALAPEPDFNWNPFQ